MDFCQNGKEHLGSYKKLRDIYDNMSKYPPANKEYISRDFIHL
jgi:hypothetical protein